MRQHVTGWAKNLDKPGNSIPSKFPMLFENFSILFIQEPSNASMLHQDHNGKPRRDPTRQQRYWRFTESIFDVGQNLFCESLISSLSYGIPPGFSIIPFFSTQSQFIHIQLGKFIVFLAEWRSISPIVRVGVSYQNMTFELAGRRWSCSLVQCPKSNGRWDSVHPTTKRAHHAVKPEFPTVLIYHIWRLRPNGTKKLQQP